MIALGFAGAFRRAELVALEIADLAFEPDGMRVHIRQSKTDQEGRGQEIAIPRGTKLRPVKAVQNWMEAAGIKDGPLFRSIDRHGTVGAALSAQSVALIVKQHADRAGLDPRELAGHSLSAGINGLKRCRGMSDGRTGSKDMLGRRSFEWNSDHLSSTGRMPSG
ncbi:MAG: hypothetical protein EON55_03905 [Alphaproteobacteria bacterium]|nr:MAG: hypothetical protein EON55_03905 [Alphaproteobacteria bacterium]